MIVMKPTPDMKKVAKNMLLGKHLIFNSTYTPTNIESFFNNLADLIIEDPKDDFVQRFLYLVLKHCKNRDQFKQAVPGIKKMIHHSQIGNMMQSMYLWYLVADRYGELKILK